MKLKLDLDALQVETFDTETDEARQGTVVGLACSETTCIQVYCDITWDGAGTCEATDVTCDSGGTGTGGTGGPITNGQTCCTYPQVICSCPG